MILIDSKNKKYPYYIYQLKIDNPQTSFPEDLSAVNLADFGVYHVVATTRPDFDPLTSRVVEAFPVEVNGQWTQQWKVEQLSTEEITNNKITVANALKESVVSATQQRLDDFARTRNYDGILSLCTYATDINPKFAADGQYGVEARSSTWARLYEILAEVEQGTRPAPSGYSDIEADLPALVWPN